MCCWERARVCARDRARVCACVYAFMLLADAERVVPEDELGQCMIAVTPAIAVGYYGELPWEPVRHEEYWGWDIGMQSVSVCDV